MEGGAPAGLDVVVDRRPHQRVQEPDRAFAVEEVDHGELVDDGARRRDVDLGELRRHDEVRLVAEDRHGLQEVVGVRGSAVSRTSTDRATPAGATVPIRSTAWGVGRYSSGGNSFSSAKSRRGLPPVTRWQARTNCRCGGSPKWARTRDDTDSNPSGPTAMTRVEGLVTIRSIVPMGMPVERDGMVRMKRTRRPSRRRGDMEQPLARRRVGPVGVVDGHQHAGVGGQGVEVRVQPVEHRRRGGQRVRAPPSRLGERRLDLLDDAAGRRVEAGHCRVEQLPHHAERGVGLHVAATRPQDAPALFGGVAVRRPQHCRLADADASLR